MFIRNNKRINIYAPIVLGGIQYNNLLDPKLREQYGITELVTPTPPEDFDPDFYYVQEVEDPPFVVYTKKSDEQIAQALKVRAKQARERAVDSLTVTTQAGNEFDADETSQNRMSRAISGMGDSDTINWILANNTIVVATKAELTEALRLAGAAMAAEWVKPYL